jgi:YHS domain-containing protein
MIITRVEANGGLTASERYAGFQARHDIHPRPGERICPVTRTKADPRCAWTIGGQVYLFCCPPCIDEFVRRAREEPEGVEGPEAYVQR